MGLFSNPQKAQKDFFNSIKLVYPKAIYQQNQHNFQITFPDERVKYALKNIESQVAESKYAIGTSLDSPDGSVILFSAK